MTQKSRRTSVFAIFTLVVVLSLLLTMPVQAAKNQQITPWPVEFITSNIAGNTTWSAGSVYYVMGDIYVNSGVTLTIEGGAIVKFRTPIDPTIGPLSRLTVNGSLRFINTGPADAQRVIFTSDRDDTLGGDSNGDEQQTLPAPGDWDYVRLTNWINTDPAYEYLNVRYGKSGLEMYNVGATNFAPVFANNIFVENTCGLTLSYNSNGYITGEVRDNTFTQNKYGFCTWRFNGSGQVNPTLSNNNFNNNSILPIYLNGTSFPTYAGNVFTGYIDPADKLGIGLGGIINGSGTLTIVDGMPFVIVAPMEITGTGVNLTIPAGAVVKAFTRYDLAKATDPLPILKVSAGITFGSTEAEPIIFTSYRDDSVGDDTNGDNLDSEPFAGDWAGVYFRDQRTPGEPNYTFQWLSFRYAVNGLLYETNTGQVGARLPSIVNDTFIGNLNGLRLKAVSNNVNSRIEPVIQNCSFEKNGMIPMVRTDTEPGVPIFLENTVQPTYINNTFTDNLHPAIGLAGAWRSSVTLTSVSGQGLPVLPYLVHGTVSFGNKDISGGVDTTATFTLPEGTIVKFFVNNFERGTRASLITTGYLQLLSNTSTAPIVFTSYYDSASGGNTAGLDSILPAPRDWGDVWIHHPSSDVVNVTFRYGDKALHVENKNTAVSSPFFATISDSHFEYNDYGIYLDIQATNDITSPIVNNAFTANSVGLGTFAKDTINSNPKVTGLSRPILSDNQFIGSTMFPIYLNGSATLEYFEQSNTFIDNDHLAIGLGGYFGAVSSDPLFNIVLPRIVAGPDAPLDQQLVPYVVNVKTNFDWNTPTAMDGGLVVKFNSATELYFYGRLTMATSPGAMNIFTSYRDDSVGGDTNGTPNPNPPPNRGDWKGLYLANPLSGAFAYSTIQYGDDGLTLLQHKNNPAPTNLAFNVSHNTFQFNRNGLTLKIGSDFDILSDIADNIFVSNDYGMHTLTETAVPHCGTANPDLLRNNFSQHSEFPIYLQGSSNPAYVDNNFWSNTHPAIAVGGIWCRDATWTKVYDNTFAQDMPYVVKTDVTQEDGGFITPILTLPDNLIVKFMDGRYIYAYGYLDMLSTPSNEIIFTSYQDDAFAGDINANGPPPGAISRSAWKSVWLFDRPGKNNRVHDLKVYYATAGLTLYYEGPENTQTATIVENVEVDRSHSAMAFVIGWRQVGSTIYAGKGNINATIRNLNIHDSNFGILTIAHDKATGIINPSLQNVTFTAIATYPIYLGGTSYFTYLPGNQIVGNSGEAAAAPSFSAAGAASEELVAAGFDLPGNQMALDSIQPGAESLAATAAPQAFLAAAPNFSPAIGLAGAWNNSGELVQIDGVPYVIVGGFPMTVTIGGSNYTPANNVTIGAVNAANTTVSVPAKTIFKFTTNLMMIAKGKLNLLSTDTQPIIFTSFKDDSAAGDTNRDGTATRPAKSDWGEVQLASSNDFGNAVVRYATKGLHIYFEGAVNLNNFSTVNHSTFMENATGISLTTVDNGDISALITDSTFSSNTIHIQGNASNTGKTGHLCVEAHHNDLFGTKASQNGIVNNNLNGFSPALLDCVAPAFDATSNYWGHASGPYHPTLNSAGLGSTVGDRVAFDPWLGSAVFPPATYSINGRITRDSAIGVGLPGVVVTLQGGTAGEVTAISDVNGYYSFSGLANGNYLVSPGLQGYTFVPPSLSVVLTGSDALGSNFIGIISPGDVAFSVNSVTAFKPFSTTRKAYCAFTVSLNKALATGKSASVEFATLAGTAQPNVDFVARTGKLNFLAGQSLTQLVNVELKVTNLADPAKFFYLTLKNPVNGTLLVASGTCTISPAQFLFIPMVKK